MEDAIWKATSKTTFSTVHNAEEKSVLRANGTDFVPHAIINAMNSNHKRKAAAMSETKQIRVGGKLVEVPIDPRPFGKSFLDVVWNLYQMGKYLPQYGDIRERKLESE